MDDFPCRDGEGDVCGECDACLTALGCTHDHPYHEGDRCGGCGRWWWERDGVGWHSLVPIIYADHPEDARIVACPPCEELWYGNA